MMGMGADLYYTDEDVNRSKELYFLEDNDDYLNPLAFDFTDAGAAVMDDLYRGVDVLYTVEDAVERFMDEIDYFRTEIAKIQHGFAVVAGRAMEMPTECDWGMELQKLNWSLIAKEETLAMLEEDLGRLLGRDVAE